MLTIISLVTIKPIALFKEASPQTSSDTHLEKINDFCSVPLMN